MISEECSKRITSVRFLLAVLIVLIHTIITPEIAAENNYIFHNSFIVSAFYFVSFFLALSAVPLFLLFSGYLQAKKTYSYGILIKKKVISLLIPYVLWMLIYLCFETIIKDYLVRILPSLVNNTENLYKTWSIKEYFHHLIGYSSIEGGQPLAAGQFWFVRNLFIFSLLSPLLIVIIKKIPFCFLFILVFLTISVELNCETHLLFSLFCYTCGLYLGIYDLDFFSNIDRIKWYEIGICFIFYCILVFLKLQIPCQILFITFFSSIIVLKFSIILIRKDKFFSVLRYLADFSFFLYAVHMPVLNVIVQKLWIRCFPMNNTFFVLFEYFGATLIIILIGTTFGIILRKICTPLYSLLNGGRK